MPSNGFLPRPDGDRVDWFINFAAKLPNYAAKYNITPTQVADMMAGAAYTSQWYDYKLALDAHKQQVTRYNDEQMNGVPAGATASLSPVPPVPPTLPAPAPGVLQRALAIGKSVKAQTGFTDADGKDLRLIGATTTIDPESMKPVLALRTIAGGRPEVVWQKYGMDGIEIYKDNGDGNFTMLAYDSYPNYTDNNPLPVAGQSSVWKYKAIYKLKDTHVGQWSDVVSITVMGA